MSERTISRRAALGLGIACAASSFSVGVAGFRVANLEAVSPLLGLSNQPVANPQENLDKVGLGQYSKIFYQSQLMQRSFGVTIYQDLIRTLESAAKGQLPDNDPKVVNLREGWGILEDASQQHALYKASKMKIDTSRTGDDPDSVRGQLLIYARVLPPLINISPMTMITVPGGGRCLADSLEIASTQNPDKGAVSYLHEAAHKFDYLSDILRIKSYLSRRLTINYLAAYFEQVQTLVDTFLSLPWQQALEYKFGNPLLYVYHEDVLEEKIGKLAKRYDYKLRGEGVDEEYNHLFYLTGRVFRQLASKMAMGNTLSTADLDYLTDPDNLDILQRGIDEVRHFLVGPVSIDGQRLPQDLSQLPEAESDASRAILAVQRARLAMLTSNSKSLSLAELNKLIYPPAYIGLPEVNAQLE